MQTLKLVKKKGVPQRALPRELLGLGLGREEAPGEEGAAAVLPGRVRRAPREGPDRRVRLEQRLQRRRTCILRDFSACIPVFFAMRERARA